MRKYFIYAAAALGLASCANDSFLGGESSGSPSQGTSEITFGISTPNMTRGTFAGADAAGKLNSHFVVYGTKHASAEDKTATNDELVFNQYNVEYKDNTAGTTASNTANWEYVGNTAYSSAVTTSQSIKYWDLSAEGGYTFYAFSSPDISYPADATNDKVFVTKTTTGDDVYKKGYTVTVKNGASIDDLYYSDREPVAKSEFSQSGKVVTLTFRNMSTKVRVGFYETVPGYSVKIDKFYYDTDAAADVTTFKAMDTESTSAFVASLNNVSTSAASNEFTVTYYDNTDASVENRPTVTNSGATHLYTLTLGTGIPGTTLGTASNTPTWDNNGNYTSVYPNEANVNPMLLRCDYTLTSTDGSGETIEVKNARAIVPVEYCKWKSNYAYTYLFKISDQSNGTTGKKPTDPDDSTSGDTEGLFPITFDAVVVATDDASYNQETITSLSSNSVTTYQEGRIVTSYNEYTDGDIYVVNSDISTHVVIPPTAIGVDNTQAQVYKVTTTGDKISEATVLANLTGSINGLTLEAVSGASLVQKVPAADGTNYDFGEKGAVKFTAASSNYYAYVYCKTKYVAATYEAASADFDGSTTYYFKTNKNVYYVASGITAENYNANKSELFVQKTAGTAGSYDIKIIKVGTLGETAEEYSYADYDYNAKSIETVGNTITFTYEETKYTGKNVLNDLARFLGALYRSSNVQTITAEFTAGVTSTFTWDPTGTLKGSNYVNVSTGETLVSTITNWYTTASPTPTQLVLTLDGVDTTFKFVKE